MPVAEKDQNTAIHLANERTFLAWIRTSVGLMAFGFVVVKFSLFVKQISLLIGGGDVVQNRGYSAI
jgi:putative membrane protein